MKRLHPHETFEIKRILLGFDFGRHPHRDAAIRDALRANRRATGHWNRRFTGRGGFLSRPDALVGATLDPSTIATALNFYAHTALALRPFATSKEKSHEQY